MLTKKKKKVMNYWVSFHVNHFNKTDGSLLEGMVLMVVAGCLAIEAASDNHPIFEQESDGLWQPLMVMAGDYIEESGNVWPALQPVQ